MSKEIIAMLVMGGFNLIGLLIVGYGLRDLYRAWQTCSWEKTAGRLIEACIDEKTRTNNKSHRSVFEVKTTYTYDVCGRPFEGTSIAPSYIPTSEQNDHEKLLNTLKSLPSLNVYYDPLRPEKCTLVPGVDGGTFALLTIGIMWLAVTLGITGMIFLIQGGDPDLIQSISMG
ncbi:hypothetical protein C5Y96_12125 [Blastopirellula marina]|uniref:DUF3592 domain-containing protein n=1 Tax=Blastopirellula marina TaxID=124 RepID=A0A2S8FFZ9_9BACT|nr:MULTISPECIES: DUF3592 domain-containing protein [Pirellulaceae]PQO31098.1 hypothetical protein C5Y96_12125 [Blastopirellula marina]RCS51492.1 DUF3592 domain-containing protein [Bremerella cremea]